MITVAKNAGFCFGVRRATDTVEKLIKEKNKSSVYILGQLIHNEEYIKYLEENGVVYNAEMTKVLFVNASVTGEYVLPETVTEIAPYAFADTKMSSVVLHDGVHTIGKYAFMNSALNGINFNGAMVKRIEDGTFSGAKLTSINLANVEYVATAI